MKNLVKYKDVVYNHIDDDKPLLGICLGLHMLFSSSQESPDIKGLDIFNGSAKKFNLPPEYKIPHMGWNTIEVNDTTSNNTTLLSEADNNYMYFVHSYYLKAKNPEDVAASTFYSTQIHASVEHGNVFACQFHPEKSSEVGLKILKNFIDLEV